MQNFGLPGPKNCVFTHRLLYKFAPKSIHQIARFQLQKYKIVQLLRWAYPPASDTSLCAQSVLTARHQIIEDESQILTGVKKYSPEKNERPRPHRTLWKIVQMLMALTRNSVEVAKRISDFFNMFEVTLYSVHSLWGKDSLLCGTGTANVLKLSYTGIQSPRLNKWQ